MPAYFDISWNKSGHAEGGWSKRSADRGGETYRGISRIANPDFRGWPIIDGYKSSANFPQCLDSDMDLQRMVREFYLAKWARLRCASMPTQELANIIFDTAIICGETTAVIYLQRALNALNRQGKLWPDIEVDGKLGPVTIGVTTKAATSANLLVMDISNVRGYGHHILAEKYQDQEENLRGWLARQIEFLPNKGV